MHTATVRLKIAAMISFTAVGILVVIAVGIYRLSKIGKRDPKMPPGPPTLPIIGALLQYSTFKAVVRAHVL